MPIARPTHPLGPILTQVACSSPTATRLRAGLVAGIGFAILLTAGTLKPDVSGLGTHEQLGLPPCSLVALTGYPCPTCGMTTAFAHSARGQFLSAVKAQPAGLILALATALTTILAMRSVLTGRRWSINWYRVRPFKTAIALCLMLLGSWVFKIVLGVVSGVLPVRLL